MTNRMKAKGDRQLADRLHKKLQTDMRTGCHEWQGATSKGGYGQIGHQRKVLYTHRLAWEIENGPIPEGMFVCHRCDNRRCCNPHHLFLGTHADNMRDMFNKGRRPTSYGLATSNGRLTTEQVADIRRRHVPGRPAGHGVRTGNTRELADEFGVTPQYVLDIAKGKWRTNG